MEFTYQYPDFETYSQYVSPSYMHISDHILKARDRRRI